jgi:hypothetical protein
MSALFSSVGQEQGWRQSRKIDMQANGSKGLFGFGEGRREKGDSLVIRDGSALAGLLVGVGSRWFISGSFS